MSYNPKHGERVIFRINPDGIDLYGTAVSESASNVALIQEDVEDGQIWAVPASQIQPDDEADRAEKAELDRDYWKNRAEITHLQHVAANKRAEELEEDRDEWKYRAETGKHADMLRYFLKDANASTDAAMARAEKAETEVAKLQAQIDAAPYATGYPVGDRVAARLAEYRERTHSAEARAEKAEQLLAEARVGWKTSDEAANAAEARIAELEDQNRVLKSDLDHARAAGEVLQRVVERHRAETWTDHDGTVRNLGGITRAELAQKLYDENERAGRAVSELAELKKALATLAGAEAVGTELP